MGSTLGTWFAQLPTVLVVSIVVGLLTGLAVGLPLLLAPGSRGLVIAGQIAALLLTPLLFAFAFADSGSPLELMRGEFWSNGIVAAVTGSVSAVAQSVIYHGVRRRREGVSAEELVKAFE